MIDDNLIGTAIFSDDKKHRYSLTRTWSGYKFEGTRPVVLWIMLNPSTADERVLDPTIRRCVRFSQDWGYRGLEVVNVCSWRATDPDEMKLAADQGFEISNHRNYLNIRLAMIRAHLIMVAWGGRAKETFEGDRAIRWVTASATEFNRDLYCLGVNGDGSPKHPLYLSKALKPKKWRWY